MNRRVFYAFVFVLGSIVTAAGAHADPVLIPAPPQLAATGYLLIDANTGEVLVEHNADESLPPASLTKMMTSYIVSGEVERGNLREDEMVNISVKAWKMGGSKMFIREGTQVSVKDLLRGVIIQSGNDASVALAERVAGSEDAFVDVMNQQAALLGMTGTVYRNATGWPAEGHVTTARDLAKLAQAMIRDYPEHYKIYAEKYFKYNGINQPNRNKLLFRDPTVDGIKTGHTEEAGYCLVSSSEKDGMRLIAVVMGTNSEEARAVESQKLLTYGFRYFQTHKLYSPGDEISAVRVWAGKADNLGLGVAKDIFLTIPRGSQDNLKATMHVDEIIKAPIAAGQELGNVVVELDGKQLLDIPLVAKQEIEQAGLFARLWDSLKLFFMDLFNLM
ncbi:D-alanyl-D-alanine carboxypeptidase [Proteobacteria bacterium 005FR1]|nr:D-alanyl-D-alanine carboxypeptidase [Proteobacteria bacterium 005FR1]